MKRKLFPALMVAMLAALCMASATVAFAGGGTVLLADGAPTVTVSVNSDMWLVSPNGKDEYDMKGAFESAINYINEQIYEVLDGLSIDEAKAAYDDNLAKLDKAVADGLIPFHSKNNGGYIASGNYDAFGEKWMSENARQNAFIVYNLSEGVNPSGWYRDAYGALMVFNAKAEPVSRVENEDGSATVTYEGREGVIFVTGNDFLLNGWSKANQGTLGMPNADAFMIGDTRYQNFQKGYIKQKTGGSVELVQYKNVKEQNGEAVEEAANANVSGWFGAMGFPGTDYKNKLGIETIEEVKAFSKAISEYYDELWESGYNPGYNNSGNTDAVVYDYNDVRGETNKGDNAYPLYNLYHGDSVADPWNRNDDWSAIAYNETDKTFFLLKDEVLCAMDGTNNSEDGSWTGKRGLCKMGAPTSELFAVKIDGKRYQSFMTGYVEISGLTPQNAHDSVTVHKDSDEGYKSLQVLLTEKYNTYKNGEPKEAFENAELYVQGDNYDAFKKIYNTVLPSDAEHIGSLLNALSEAMEKLELSDPKPALNKIVGEVEAISNNEHIYTSASFMAFEAAVQQAKEMAEDTNVNILAKTQAYKATLALLVKFEDIPEIANPYTVSKNSEEFFAFANGKGWTETEAAFNAAIAYINKEIGYILDGRTLDDSVSDLNEAVASGRIPFYSLNNGGYIKQGNADAYGEKWMSENAKQNAFVLYNLNDGMNASSWARSGMGAFMVFNAKANAPYSGRSGVIFVTGDFAAAWNQSDLGMPNADAFEIGGVRYQNFQKGYLKSENGNVTLVKYKNVVADNENGGAAKETAAYSNESGWYGAVGIKDYKNTMDFTTEEQAKEFSSAASAYYDEIWASGFNPGYSGNDGTDKIVFGGKQIRDKSSFKVENLYHGDSVAVCYGDDRPNWSAIAYNAEEKKFYLICDEILYAMEGKDNYAGSLEIGAPVSEVFTVAAGEYAGRYQAFEDGYIFVPGIDPQNDYNVTVEKTEEGAGKAELAALLKEAYDSFKTAVKDEYDAGESCYYQGYTDFANAYNVTLNTDATLEQISKALGDLSDAHSKLITQELYDEYEAAVEAINEIGESENPNENKKYTSESFDAFIKAAQAAIEMDIDTAELMRAAINALNKAVETLVTTESVYSEIKAEIDEILAGDNKDIYYTGASYAEFKEACESVQEPADEDYEAMEAAIEAYRTAKDKLAVRLEMGDLGVQNVTLGLGDEFTVNVTGDGNGEVSIEIVSGDAATLSGNTLTAVKTGTVTLKITKAGGDAYYDKSVTVTVTVNKKDASAPGAAEIENVTANSVTVKAVEGAEYRLGENGEWQTSNVFEGLQAGVEYTVYVRFAETDTQNASEAVSVKVTTAKGASESDDGCGCGSDAGASAWIIAIVMLVAACVVLVKKGRKQHE